MENDVVHEVWPDLVKAFSRLPTVSAGIHLLPVGLTGRKRMNRVRVHQDGVVRVSDGSNSQDQPIRKDHFIEFARMAVRAPGGRFCIKGTQIVKTGRCGSFVSTSLALLPYFEYRSGQILVFSQDQFERVKGPRR